MSIANVSIVGNLVKAPQQVQFSSGKVKTTLVVAVNTPYREKRGGDSADFYKIETWGKLAELVAGRLDKGNQVTANGRLQMEKWKDNKGIERVTPTISASEIAFPQRLRAVPTAAPEATSESASESSEVSFIGNTPVPEMESKSESEEGEESDSEEAEEDDSSESYGEPNTATRAAPVRSRREKQPA